MRKTALLFVALFAMIASSITYAFDRGIYITQSTAESSKRINYLIKQAKLSGINTFIIDMYYKNSRYAKNIKRVRAAGIKYVARIVVFPYGGTASQVRSRALWEKRWKRAKRAIDLGASSIQLDYIRFKPSQRPSKKNAHEILKVIKFFKQRLAGTGVKLQIDVFGVAAMRPSIYIGQDMRLFAGTVDAINPMVYPSHYEPFRHHAVRPYRTVLDSVVGLKKQINGHNHIKVYPFIELYNYRYPMSRSAKIRYIKAQIQATKDAGANGWYAWSAKNKYGLLFYVLKSARR